METIKGNEQKKCFHHLLVRAWKAQTLFHFNSSILASMYSSVQNTGTGNVGKRMCEVTGEGERPDRYYQCFPAHCRGTASSHPACAGTCFTNTNVLPAHPSLGPQIFGDGEWLTWCCSIQLSSTYISYSNLKTNKKKGKGHNIKNICSFYLEKCGYVQITTSVAFSLCAS